MKGLPTFDNFSFCLNRKRIYPVPCWPLQGEKAVFGLQKKLAGRLGVVPGFRPGTCLLPLSRPRVLLHFNPPACGRVEGIDLADCQLTGFCSGCWPLPRRVVFGSRMKR
jgi:hypothetical protein